MATCLRTLDFDTQLMLGVQRDDDASFSLLVERHRTVLVQHLSRMVQNPAVAEELAQDVFLRIHRSRRTWEPNAKFSTWLFRISTNVAYNYFRDQRHNNRNVSLDRDLPSARKRDFADRMGTVEESMVSDVRVQQIRDAIHSLPVKQRAAVLMHKYEEMDYAEIAQALGCTPGAVKAMMFRAYESLRAQLASLA
ncbi:MAG: polymerase, sigma-24 subunit, subfamily [Bryobacterales bacterium]|nr:polymerase, sigma-24 subunit, subfamily [Bryobacterales bacterium]